MADNKDSSPSEELLKSSGATADDYVLSSPIDDHYGNSESDREGSQDEELSAEEIAAALYEAQHDSRGEPDPEPSSGESSLPDWATEEPSSEPLEPYAPLDSYSTEPSSGGDPDPWSTPSGDWEQIEAERAAKRAARWGTGRSKFNISALFWIGIGLVLAVGIVVSLLDGKEAIQDQAVGDCFIAGDAEELTEVEVVDCSEPHDNEVFAVIDASVLGSSYPGEDPLFNWMFDQCLGYFEPYTGQSFEESVYYFDTLIPTADGWSQGDKEGLCTIIAVDGALNIRMVSGSARNSGSQS